MKIDSLDKLILGFLSSGGNSSYKELATKCNVTRNTAYRRIASLERAGIIKNINSCSIDYSKLGIETICITADVPHHCQKEVYDLLRAKHQIKMVWRCYAHQVNTIIVAFCDYGNAGNLSEELSVLLEKFGSRNIEVIVGFVWEKLDLSLFREGKDEKEPTKHNSEFLSNEQ